MNAFAQTFCQKFPAIPVIFGETILDADDWEIICKAFNVETMDGRALTALFLFTSSLIVRKDTPKLFAKYKKRYSPHASVASLYLWAIAGGACASLKDCAPAKNRSVKSR